LDLRSKQRPLIEVTTQVHRTTATLIQKLGWIMAALGVFAALALVGIDRSPRRPWAVGRWLAGGAKHAQPIDAAVGLVLAGWWVLSPAFIDDGWVGTRQQMFDVGGGFSNYFDTFGRNLPWGYWLEWAQHWVTQASPSLILLRIPSLLCLGATWVLCRWIFARLSTSRSDSDALGLVVLATTFLTGALAWGMTLRPEPAIAFLVAAVVVCAVQFSKGGTAGPLAFAAALIPLAITAHHAGVIAIAPMIVVAPALARWARREVAAAITLATAAVSLLVLLVFLGSDVSSRSADARFANEFGTSKTDWRDEFNRYADLSDFLYGTPLRRASVALLGLALVAFLLRLNRRRQGLFDLPAATLGVSLLLLVVTPSKWPWHFGTLIGLAPLAVAAESVRIRVEAAERRSGLVRPFVVLGAALIAAAWSWSPREDWNVIDLRTLDWTPAVERFIPFSALAILAPVGLVIAAYLLAIVRRQRVPLAQPAGRIGAWTPALLAVPIIGFTVAILAADAARTADWTLARQNLAVLGADPGCGLGDDVLLPRKASMRPVRESAATRQVVPAWMPTSPVRGVDRYPLGPTKARSSFSPWLHVPSTRRFGLFVSGVDTATEAFRLQWARLHERRAVLLDTVRILLAPPPQAAEPWTFVTLGTQRAEHPHANAVRIVASTPTSPLSAIAVTSLVSYQNQTLAADLMHTSPEYVQPNLLTYLPCAHLPALQDGVADVPHTIVSFGNPPSPFAATSPFTGVLDVYRLQAMPLTDSRRPPKGLIVYAVVSSIPGGVIASPEKTTRST
jgi:hypothetical protein